MRIQTVASIITALVIALGCREEPGSVSPFAIYGRPDMVAGIPFSRMENAAKNESLYRYTCDTMWAGGKQCSTKIEPGTLTATVNGKGRVVRLKIETKAPMRGISYDDRTQAQIERASREFARMREEWSVATPAADSAAPRSGASLYWVDPHERWSAGMWYKSMYTYLPSAWQQTMGHYTDTLAYLPDSVVTTDRLEFDAFMKLRPRDPGPPDDPAERVQFDLAMAAAAQAEYFQAHGTYATTADVLLFAAGDGVQIEVRDATRTGWAAVGTHDAVPGLTCVIHDGRVAAPPATPGGVTPSAGEVACDAAPSVAGAPPL